jgi:hypothetical protein
MNVNAQAGAISKKHRPGLVAAVSLLATLAVGGCLYWYWTTTPSFAIASIAMSVQDHDADTFEKYIDIDSVTGTAFDQMLDGPARRYVASRVSGPMVMLGVDVLRFFKGDAIDIAHDQVVEFVRNRKTKSGTTNGALAKVACAGMLGVALPLTGSLNWSGHGWHQPVAADLWKNGAKQCPTATAVVPAPLKASAGSCPEKPPERFNPALGLTQLKTVVQDFGLSSSGFRSIKYFRPADHEARLALEFYSPKLGQTWVAEFKMEDCGGYWRVTQLVNLNSLVERYIATSNAYQL